MGPQEFPVIYDTDNGLRYVVPGNGPLPLPSFPLAGPIVLGSSMTLSSGIVVTSPTADTVVFTSADSLKSYTITLV